MTIAAKDLNETQIAVQAASVWGQIVEKAVFKGSCTLLIEELMEHSISE